MTENEWKIKAKLLLKSELKRKDVTYEELAKRLNEIGIDETLTSVNNKINRGAFTFTFAFALQCFEVIGCKIIRFDE